MKKPSIKTITIKSLINVLLGLAIILLCITSYHFRSLSTKAIENQALAHAELVKAGLTAHMKMGAMAQRDYYLDEIQQLHQVKSLTVIRNQPVTQQFGPGRNIAITPEVAEVFNSKQPKIIMHEFSMQPTIRVIIPYIASDQGTLNCLQCHQVSHGAVLGGVDIELDVSEYRNHALLGIFGLAGLSGLAFLLVYVNTSRTIRQHVQKPLEYLISHAAEAYQQQIPLQLEQYKTREFTHVADEINLFNAEIVIHQEALKRRNLQLQKLNNEIENTLRETLFTIGLIEGMRSQETANHTKRVSLYCQRLAQLHKLNQREVDLITMASPLHDIGKIGIPDSILLKPGQLTEEERTLMMSHPKLGYDMLKHSDRDTLRAAATVAHQHHEKWDGSGYPQALKGKQIDIFARIVAIADVFDALYSPRVYKPGWPIEKIIALFTQESGKHFDPKLVAIFLENLDDFIAIYHQHPAKEH